MVMRQITLILMFCALWDFSSAQNITTAEYFFDTNDLGFGNNTPLTVTQANESYTIATTGLSVGFHNLYIRVFDQAANEGAGVWSHYDRSTFYVGDIPSGQNIVALRYRIDDGSEVSGQVPIDPGATTINETFMVSTEGLEEGFYNFYIETQVEDGTWSLYDRQIFYVKDTSDLPSDIVAAEYWIDNGEGVPFDIATMPLSVIIPSDFPVGDHTICVRVQNSNGDWSLYCCSTFNVELLGVNEHLYNETQISPNPFKDNISINISQVLKLDQIEVYDITGKLVYSNSEDIRTIDLGHLQSGVYILKLVANNEQATFRLVKQ